MLKSTKNYQDPVRQMEPLLSSVSINNIYLSCNGSSLKIFHLLIFEIGSKLDKVLLPHSIMRFHFKIQIWILYQ